MPSLNDDHRGPLYWRSLEELADTPEFRELLAREFPPGMWDRASGPTRRRFLKIMGASLALAGMTGCRRWPQEKLAPFAYRPEGRVPGTTEQYATAMELSGYAIGLLVTSYDGRPIKVEGNPLHPASLGATHPRAQASVLELYDPDRSRHLVERPRVASGAAAGAFPRPAEGGQVRSWEDFLNFARPHFSRLVSTGGQGLAVLSETSYSPTWMAVRERFLSACPQARWFEYESISRDNELLGTLAVYDRRLRPQVHLDRADVVLCLDADLLGEHPNAVRHARDWAERRATADQGTMNRFHVVESGYSVTGGVADHRLPMPSSQIPSLVQEIARQLGVAGGSELRLSNRVYAFVRRVVADLRQAGSRALVMAGPVQPVETHRLCLRINEALGAVGQTITFTHEPDVNRPPHREAIIELSREMAAGRVETLLIIGGNPAYDAPADARFDQVLAEVPVRIHLSLYDNETSRLCHWHLPRAHYLESWGDARAWDGTISVVQPLIQPFFGGRTGSELLALLLNEPVTDGYELVRQTFRTLLPEGDFEKQWRRVLHDGLLQGSAFPAVTGLVRRDREEVVVVPRRPEEAILGELHPAEPPTVEVVFRADSRIYDGRFANNGWLQELPDPLTLLVWDNAAVMSPLEARNRGLRQGDLVILEAAGPTGGPRQVEVPVFLLPGHAERSVTLALGYGRRAAGRVGNGVGFDVGPLRRSEAMDVLTGVVIHPPKGRYRLACVQDHHAIDTKGFEARRKRVGMLIREATLGEYRASPHFVHEKGGHVPPLIQLWEPPKPFADRPADEHRWAMAIDLNRCIGCQGCIIACQAENNIPVVGKEEVAIGREMHWIRVDRFFKGDPMDPNPQVVHQPMTCHQCENAPCEQVCPVPATLHDTEGLNVMVYNRCVGTRYCSNNCPYKVRRYNYFDYHAKGPHGPRAPWLGMPDSQPKNQIDSLRQLGFNPEVTVRMRGVMEKCTFCTQRIMSVKIAARNAKRPIADGEITPACAQSCPTQAIVFGDLNDVNSRVRAWHAHQRSYAVLEELNVRPRTRYLGRVRNPAEDPSAAPPQTSAET